MSVVNTDTCNAIDTAGCDQVPQAIAFGNSGGSFDGSEPVVAVNQVTNTIYATDTYDFSTWVSPGLFMMNGANCDRPSGAVAFSLLYLALCRSCHS
jgi:hypothetical protein